MLGIVDAPGVTLGTVKSVFNVKVTLHLQNLAIITFKYVRILESQPGV